MRVLAAILITLALMFGTYHYTRFADSVRRAPVEVQTQIDDAKWQVEIVRSFPCVPDPDYDTPALLIQMKATDVLRRTEPILLAAPVVVELTGVEQGSNEVYVEANVATLDDFEFSASETPQVLRVMLKRGSTVIADRSFWLEDGQTGFKESVLFEAPRLAAAAAGGKPEDDHSHSRND